MTAVLVTASELARALNVSPTAVAKARNAGRLTAIGDRFDLAVAQIQWEANRKRRRADQRPAAPAVDADATSGSDTGSGAGYWDARTKRERAEASMAELKEAELRGELVRRAAVERELSSRLIALRESLELLGDRLAAAVAAESDPGVCRRLIRDEHRRALEAFVRQVGSEIEREAPADGSS